MRIDLGNESIRPDGSQQPFSGWKNLAFLLPMLFLIESLIQFYGQPLFHLFYIPVIVIASAFLSFKIIASCMFVIFLLGAPVLLRINGYLTQGNSYSLPAGRQGSTLRDAELLWGIYLATLVTGAVSYYFLRRTKKISKKAVKELETLKNSALNLEASTEISLFDEDRFSHLVKSIFETQKELNDMLNLSKKSVNADSVTLFILEDGDFIPKSSTEDIRSDSIYAVKGYLSGVIREKKPFIIPSFKGSLGIEPAYRTGRSNRLLNLGQHASKKTGSFLCVPVFDGNIPIGVLAMAGKSETAFGEREKDIAVSFADQIVQILSKKRSQIQIDRVTKGFRALHEANLSLGTSLKVEEIAEKFVEHVFGMAPSSAVGFFVADKGKLRVIAKKGFEPEKESFYPKNTLFDLIIKNKHPLQLSNVDKQQAVYPFRINDTRTFLGIPIISENEVIGIFAITSKEPDALSSFHGQFLKILTDQAAMAMTNAKLHKELGRLAMTDGLTGLFNHKHFHEMLLMEFQRTERTPQSLSLMLIDIDHFKKINDSYGHPAGDMVLASLSAILRKTLRGIDILARYGGEEFAAVLINTGAGGAKKMADRLREHVMNNPFFIEKNKLTITLSIGIAIYPHDAGTKDELIEKADQALYYAKNNGRNQVCLWKNMGE